MSGNEPLVHSKKDQQDFHRAAAEEQVPQPATPTSKRIIPCIFIPDPWETGLPGALTSKDADPVVVLLDYNL